MNLLVLAVYSVAAPGAFFVLVALARIVGQRLAGADFSWARYAAWLFGTLVGALLVVAATSELVFRIVGVALLAWVLFRAAIDAQSTTVREKVGFLQLYGGFSLVEYLALSRTGSIASGRATAVLAQTLEQLIGESVLPPLAWVVGARSLPSWGSPAAVSHALAGGLADRWLFACALGTFTISALAYAHFAEHATPKLGLSLLPAPTAFSVALPVLVILARTRSPAAHPAFLAATFLAPFFVAEGVWVAHRLLSGLSVRRGLIGLLALLSLLAGSVAYALAAVGWVFHLVRLRAFEPVLGAVDRTALRPRLRTGVYASVGAALLCAGLWGLELVTLKRLSPALLEPPAICADVTMSPSTGGVLVASPRTAFTIEAEERPLAGGDGEDLARTCAKAGARPCTSDEWALACVCSYANDSLGGPKIFTNEKLVYRRDSEREGTKGPGSPEVHGLLTGGAELVLPAVPGGGVLLAGPADALPDPLTADCRTRAIVSSGALSRASTQMVAARCCR